MTSRIGSRGLVAVAVLFTLSLRAPYLTWPLMPDEAGLLIIAQEWHEGHFLYGDYFVGRGVVLMLVYALASVLGGDIALRLLGCAAATMLVIAAGWAGHQLRGRAGAGWAAAVAAAYSSTYAFSAQVMNERLLAAALVTASCACTLAAVRSAHQSPRKRSAVAVLAGVAASSAVLVVQSYAEGVVFACVLLLASLRAGPLTRAATIRIAGAEFAGMLLPVAALAVAVLATWLTAAQVWFQMFGFRLAAVPVLDSMHKPKERVVLILTIAALTGIVVLVLCHLSGYRQLRHRRDLAPAWLAVFAMVPVAGAGMVLGGAWYPDYLLELVPALVLATALVAPQPSWSGLGMRAGAAMAALAAVVATFMGLQWPVLGTTTNEADVGRWLATGAERDDTAVVLWGRANVLHDAGMISPYPYLWGLLTRTLDPDLHLMLSTLRGPTAPTWIVEWDDLGTLTLDGADDLTALIKARYTRVGAPCGYTVYLLRTERREVPSAAACGVGG